jgi:hypothetical protein
MTNKISRKVLGVMLAFLLLLFSCGPAPFLDTPQPTMFAEILSPTTELIPTSTLSPTVEPISTSTLLPTAETILISTSSPTLTQTIAAISCLDGRGMIITEFVWLRTGPGVHYRALAILDKDVPVTALGKSQDGQWTVVSVPSGEQGWVSAPSIQLNTLTCDLMVVTAPPTQTPLPTVDIKDPGNPCAHAHRQYQRIMQAYGTNSGDPGYDAGADLNGDGTVNIVDVGIMIDRWPEDCPSP